MLRHALLLAVCAGAHAAAQPETVDLRVEGQTLFTLIERVARQCDAGLSVHHAVQDRLETEVTINARDARWQDAMQLFRSQYRLAVRLDGDRLVVEDADAAHRREVVAVRYDIRALRAEKSSRPGPLLSLPEPGGTGAMLLPPIEAAERLPLASLIETIRQRVAPASWTSPGVAIEEHAGDLVIVHRPAVQQQVAALLAELEGRLLRQVQIRVWRMPDDAGDGPAILDRAGFAARRAGLGAPSLAFVTGDDQQNHAWSGQLRHVLADVDVVQSRLDPIISALAGGLAVDVHPLITRAGLRLTVRFDGTAPAAAAQAPVRDAAGTVITQLDLPAQERDTARLTVVVPDGGAAVLRFGQRAYAIQAETFGAGLPAP